MKSSVPQSLTAGKKLTGYIDDLGNCGFIRRYQAIGAKTKNTLYQLVDNFTLFYFRFMDRKNITDANYWSKIQTTPIITAGAVLLSSGYVCYTPNR